MIHIKKGLDIPVGGKPRQQIDEEKKSKQIAINGLDYIGMKPTMLVKVGDNVKKGQPLFSCKKLEGVLYTSPADGKILKINRGVRRILQTIVIDVNETEQDFEFSHYNNKSLDSLEESEITSLLIESGLWSAIKTRPFSLAPQIGSKPKAIFISAMDTNPLALDPEVVIKEYLDDFKNGIEILSKISEGKTYVGVKRGSSLNLNSTVNVEIKKFDGVHPAGNVGTHIHFIEPVNANHMVWTIGYQDVIAVSKLFQTGKLWTDRYIAIGGPEAKNPRIVKSRIGANLNDLMEGELNDSASRVISGSILNGHQAAGSLAYLGRYHTQVSVLREGKEREFFGWMCPGTSKFSIARVFLQNILPGKKSDFSTSTHGSPRALVPIGQFERIMPLDILPTPLLISLMTNDTDKAQLLGALELDEEDLALCTFVCPGKTDYGPILRDNLTIIEKEG